MRTLGTAAAALACAVLVLAACSQQKTEAPADPEAAAGKTKARFYYDLGEPSVDVSAYPDKQREEYKLFLSVCGTCHSPARPLNSPYVGAETWRGFVSRMHGKMEGRAVLLSPEDQERILDFLVYDSRARKVDRSTGFQAEQEMLKKSFEGLTRR